MLPNFLKNEPDLSKPPLGGSIQSPSAAFPARPFLAAPRTSERTMSMIGPDLTINGNLISKGEVQIDGIVEGDIHGSHVIVGETATISGGIVADEVVIRGHVIGSVHSKRVMLQSTCQVEGDIFHQSLSIEHGAMFEGKSRRTNDDPRTIALKSSTASLVTPPELPN